MEDCYCPNCNESLIDGYIEHEHYDGGIIVYDWECEKCGYMGEAVFKQKFTTYYTDN